MTPRRLPALFALASLPALVALVSLVSLVSLVAVIALAALSAFAASSPPLSVPQQAAPAPLAQIDGDLVAPGLDSAVEVRRDRWGVPHIYARTEHDLLFAQGFVAAQDRLWQMEMWRRQGEGRLAEVLGLPYVDRDRAARLFRYRGDMAAEWSSYAPDARRLVAAFVQGVNAYIAQTRDRLPVEFARLRFAPEPWTPEVPLGRVTGLSGASNASVEVLRARLVQAVGVERAQELLPPDPPVALDPVPGLDLSGIGAGTLGGTGQTFSDVPYDRVDGSNNWVVSGAKTVTGKPILANDPHRVITNPAVRYITHLVGPGWNVIGAGEPASPGVSIGHNERIAFGLTIVGMDQQDVYVERIGPCPGSGRAGAGRRCAFSDGRWTPLQTIVDTIKVKGAASVIARLEFTRHGPIVSEDTARGRAYVVRTVHREPGSAAYLASLSLDRARNWNEFRAAMGRWRMPTENMIYADVDGNIGWIASGLMPRRSWTGLLPVPGDGRFEWRGFVPVESLPQAYNPRSGYVATANANILPPGYNTPIAYDWATRYRVNRLHQVLRDSAGFSVRDFERLQHDDRSLLAQSLVPVLIAAAGRAHRDSPELRRLTSWDYRMSREGGAPLVFEAWAPALWRRVSRRWLPPAAVPILGARADYEQLEQVVRNPPASLGRDPQQVIDSLALLAFDDAVAEVQRRAGTDRTQWRWGDVHVATFRHPLDSAFDLKPVSRGGDANTVYATGGPAFRQTSGASYRQVIDLADFDNSVAINVPGQSAQPGSPHYGDLLELWGRDEYFPLVFSRARVERETAHTLWLRPGTQRR